MEPTVPDLSALAALRDPLGVLTVYIDADPRAMSGPKPAWAIEVKNRLGELRRGIKDVETHDRWSAIHTALERLEPRIAALEQPHAQGRGRGLFAPLSEDRAEEVELQVPLETSVVLQDRPYLEPLLVALERSRPTGLVAVDRDRIRVVDLRVGVAEQIAQKRFGLDTAHWGQRVGTPGHNPAAGPAGGPSGGGPATGAMHQQSGSAQRDRFDRAVEDHLERLIAQSADDVLELAGAQGWERLAVTGDPRLTRALVGHMPKRPGLEVLTFDQVVEWERPAQLAAALAPALEQAQAQHELELVREAADRAAAHGHGAVGPAAVADALTLGRVDRLLIQPGRPIEGVRAPDGRIAPLGVVPPGVAPQELIPEPRLDERMVEMALDASSRVVPVSGTAAQELDRLGGVAAILRW